MQHSKYWLLLAVSSLGLACLLALFLVFSRIPGWGDFLSEVVTFYTTLVLHVNLSLFIWLFSIIALIWSLAFNLPHPNIERLALFSCSTAVLLMLLVPLLNQVEPVLSNYLPILNHSWYLYALGLFIIGFCLLLLETLLAPLKSQMAKNICPCCLKIIAIGVLCALLTACLVYLRLPNDISTHHYYELLFWASGHQMQIVYCLLLLWSWLWLAKIANIDLPYSTATIRNWFIIGFSPIILSSLIPLYFLPTNPQFKVIYTDIMTYGSWLALPYLGGKLFIHLVKQKSSLFRTIILISMTLSVFGLFLGTQITPNNLMIPAHYHAITGAINVALMLLAYQMLPHMNFNLPANRQQIYQTGIYATGVIFLVTGLAWSGHLGMVRKTLSTGALNFEQLSALGLMGIGGLLSLLGCFLFLRIIFSQMRIPSQIQQWLKSVFSFSRLDKEKVI